MLKVVFPTNQNMSYISSVESNFEDSNYLTVVDLQGQSISDVHIIKNPHPHSSEEILSECKDKHFGVLILPETTNLPIEELKKNGTSVFKTKNHKMVLDVVGEFIQDKLVKIS